MESTPMEPNTPNKTNRRDRLSELPDEILVHILSYLPIKDVVKTVLICRFGDLWTLIPSLYFDDIESSSDKWRYAKDDGGCIPWFASFVRNVLTLYKRIPMDEFKLQLYRINVSDDSNKSFSNEITTWIKLAIDGEVKQLTVRMFHGDGSILPPCVFTSQFLVELKIDNCRIGDLRNVEMRSLRKLSLVDLDIDDGAMNRLISGSPSLQELTLYGINGLEELCFIDPNIEKLNLAIHHCLLDCPNLHILSLQTRCPNTKLVQVGEMVNVSSVREVNVGCGYILDSFVDFVKKIRNVQVFEFWDDLFQSSMYKKLVIPRTRWKRLHLNIKTELQIDQFLDLCNVLTSSSLLEELITYSDVRSYYLDIMNEAEVEILELPPPCSMQQLKTVTMHVYDVPCAGLLRLAEYFLNSSVALEKMVILPSKNEVESFDKHRFVKRLLSFPRASTNARVIFGPNIY